MHQVYAGWATVPPRIKPWRRPRIDDQFLPSGGETSSRAREAHQVRAKLHTMHLPCSSLVSCEGGRVYGIIVVIKINHINLIIEWDINKIEYNAISYRDRNRLGGYTKLIELNNKRIARRYKSRPLPVVTSRAASRLRHCREVALQSCSWS